MKLPVKTRGISLQVAGESINTSTGKWQPYDYHTSGDFDYVKKYADAMNARDDHRHIVVQALVHLEPITIASEDDVRALRRASWTTQLSFGVDWKAKYDSLVELIRDRAADLMDATEEPLDD